MVWYGMALLPNRTELINRFFSVFRLAGRRGKKEREKKKRKGRKRRGEEKNNKRKKKKGGKKKERKKKMGFPSSNGDIEQIGTRIESREHRQIQAAEEVIWAYDFRFSPRGFLYPIIFVFV